MISAIGNQICLDDRVQQLVVAAQGRDQERRACGRQPFFHPVLLSLEEDRSRRYSAFTRDISPNGVGLLHNMAIRPQIVSLITRLDEQDEAMELPVRLIWCLPCGDGWYISGGEFDR